MKFINKLQDNADKIALSTIKSNTEIYDQKAADLILENTFVFTRTWDMEPCFTPYKINPLDWKKEPNEDEEWTFMLNRFTYLAHLAITSIMKDDHKYLIKGKELILDWINKHPNIKQSNSTRTLDTGMRINSWFEFLPYLVKFNLIDRKEIKKIENSIIKQIIYMKQEYIPKYTLSNWGLIQTASIINIIDHLEYFKEKEEITTWAIKEYIRQLDVQIYDDGWYWEQSTMYHAEVLNYSLNIYYQNFLSKEHKNKIKKLAEAFMYQVSPNNTIEPFGDSDVASGISLLNRCAVYFKDDKFKRVNKLNDFENLYEFTKEMIDKFNNLTINYPKELNYDGLDGGMFTSRSSWDKSSNFTLFSNGSMGSGHAHSDNNHFSIYYKGKPILVDTGRYTYREDDNRRLMFKSQDYHNSLYIENNEHSIPDSSWTFEKYVKPVSNKVKHNHIHHFYQGTVQSLLTKEPYTHTRKIMFSDMGIWIILDDVRTKGNQTVKTSLNFHPDVEVKLKNDTTDVDNLNLYLFNKDNELRQSYYSSKYNNIKKSKQLISTTKIKDKAQLIKILVPKEYKVEKVNIYRDETEVLSDDIAIAYKIEINPQHTITYINVHDELYFGRKNLWCEGVVFHAKGIIIEKIEGVVKTYVMNT